MSSDFKDPGIIRSDRLDDAQYAPCLFGNADHSLG